MFGFMLSKFIVFLSVILLILFTFSECLFGDKILDSLPKYESEEVYFDKEGFREYTDYAKYYYDDITAEDLEENKYFNKVTETDVDNLKTYYYDFNGYWYGEMELKYDNYKGKFDFKAEQIEEGDYYYIDTIEGEPIVDTYYGKFDCYTVYYFDLENQTLYYFHNNT